MKVFVINNENILGPSTHMEDDLRSDTRYIILAHPNDTFDGVKELFDLHPLTIEDMSNGRQRPKHEVYDKYDFVTAREISLNKTALKDNQISMVFNDKSIMIVSVARASTVMLHVLNTLIEMGTKWKPVNRGPDRIAHAVLDKVIDGYISVVDQLENVSAIADDMIESNDPESMKRVHWLRKNAIAVRKTVRPFRELCNSMSQGRSKYITSDMDVYMRDLYDHVVRVTESVDTLRDFSYSMSEMYLSSNAAKMNDIMKVLTVITTIFTPVAFLSSVYGMNFKDIPELSSAHGYLYFWLAAAVLTIGQLWFYRRKGWV